MNYCIGKQCAESDQLVYQNPNQSIVFNLMTSENEFGYEGPLNEYVDVCLNS